MNRQLKKLVCKSNNSLFSTPLFLDPVIEVSLHLQLRLNYIYSKL